MLDSLTNRLTGILDRLRGFGRLTEENIQEALREVRVALLEADVNFKVVKGFIDRVRVKAVGQDVLQSLTPGQQVVKVVRDELVELLGGSAHRLAMAPHPPTVVMLVGLQGSGKTTSAAKLARHFQKQGQHPLLAAVPGGLFMVLYAGSRRRLVLVAAGAWFLYVPYEYGMKLRILCSGECNIRVDLLILYPALLLISAAGLVAFARTWLGRRS